MAKRISTCLTIIVNKLTLRDRAGVCRSKSKRLFPGYKFISYCDINFGAPELIVDRYRLPQGCTCHCAVTRVWELDNLPTIKFVCESVITAAYTKVGGVSFRYRSLGFYLRTFNSEVVTRVLSCTALVFLPKTASH